MKLEEKVIAISGASRGIGRAIALGLAQEGARLALAARSLEPLESLKKEILAVALNPGSAVGSLDSTQNAGTFLCKISRPYHWGYALKILRRTAHGLLRLGPTRPTAESGLNRPDSVFVGRCDIANNREVAAWVDNAVNFFGRIDVLINNAGVLGTRSTIADYPEDSWRQTMDVNVNGTFYVTKAVLNRVMLKTGSGVIINVSSGVGRVGKPKWGAYALSKFAMEGFTQVLANELKEKGIRVFAINPEPTRSKMRAEAYPQENPDTLKPPEALTKVFIRLINEMGLEDSGKSFSYSELAS